MLISIITVTKNNEDTVEEAVRSVISQTYKNIEYIIIDGASDDGTLNILKQYANRITKIISEPDAGVYDAMNKGISMASGDVIGFLNADDVYADSGVVRDIVKAFDDPDVDGCYSDLVYVDRRDTGRVLRRWKSGSYEDGSFQKGWIPPHPTFYAKRSVYDRYGLHDLSFRLAADHELMLRMLLHHRIRLHYIDRVTVKMRLGGITNKSISNVVKQNIEILRARRRYGIRRAVTTYLVYKTAARVRQYLRRNRLD